MPSELLKGFRLLDLTDEKGALCGKMFADLGAEVIKVEPIGGCTTRRIPPGSRRDAMRLRVGKSTVATATLKIPCGSM